MSRRPRPGTAVALATAVVATVGITGCGYDPRGFGSSDDAETDPIDTTPRLLTDLSWTDEAILGGSLDTCGSTAVLSSGTRRVEVLLGVEGRVVVPVPVPDKDTDLRIIGSWVYGAACVPTRHGDVVVVEGQATPHDNPSAVGPRLIAGFTPEGRQLWAREVDRDVYGNYDGRGAMLLESPDDGTWQLVEPWSGLTVARGSTEEFDPNVVLSQDLIGLFDGDLMRLPKEKRIPGFTTDIAQVDDERAIATDVDGIGLVDLETLTFRWQRFGLQPAVLWDEIADLSTGVAVFFDPRGRVRGVDLMTGEDRWTAPVEREGLNGVELQIGSGVVVFRTASGGGQVVLDSATGELLEPDGRVIADQKLLLLVREGVPRPVTVAQLD